MRLFLGGARSGKSRLAEDYVLAASGSSNQGAENSQLFYLATGAAGDDEMQARIQQHQSDRCSRWQTIEEPVHLSQQLSELAAHNQWVLVDCLTLWISNCLHANCWQRERDLLLSEIDRQLAAGNMPNWTFVSNEVGSGVVPLGQLSREFIDASGWLHQALADRCPQVTLVVAGLALPLKS